VGGHPMIVRAALRCRDRGRRTAAPSERTMTSTARRLLVSVPTLEDPNFFRTVVFMIEHNDEGAVGVVLNQPTDAALTDALPEWSALSAPPAVAFVGGPVQQQDAVIGLARFKPGAAPVGEMDGWQPLLGRI